MAKKKTSSRERRAPKPWGQWAAAALLLLPGLLGTQVLIGHLGQFKLMTHTQVAFLTGAGVYLVMHLLLWKPVFIHVMGHELTHAFWAVVLGGKIKSLLVSEEGGQVTLSKSNFFIALAPYFFPLYTFLILPVYFIAAPAYRPLLAFLVGFTLALHVALTLHSLRERQSDLREVGVVFSLVFVYGMNLIVLVLILSVITPRVITFPEFARETGQLAWEWILRIAGWLNPSAGGVRP